MEPISFYSVSSSQKLWHNPLTSSGPTAHAGRSGEKNVFHVWRHDSFRGDLSFSDTPSHQATIFVTQNWRNCWKFIIQTYILLVFVDRTRWRRSTTHEIPPWSLSPERMTWTQCVMMMTTVSEQRCPAAMLSLLTLWHNGVAASWMM